MVIAISSQKDGSMTEFEEAQRLFSSYQSNKGIQNLRDSLDILQGIIENQDADSQKAVNLKNLISKYVTEQARQIFTRGNVSDFTRDIENIDDPDVLRERIASVLLAALHSEDLKYLSDLLLVQSEYFSNKTTTENTGNNDR